MAVEPVDLDRVAGLERRGYELRVLEIPCVVVKRDIEDIRGGYGGVEGDDEDARVLGFLDDAVERVGRIGVQQNDVDALRLKSRMMFACSVASPLVTLLTMR